MEFLPGLFVSGIVILFILRWLKVRILGSSGMEPNGKRTGNADDALTEGLKQRAESRRLRLKREGITVENSEDFNPGFSGICPSCLKQNEQNTHYCVFCGIKLDSTRSELILQGSGPANGLAFEMGRDREEKHRQDREEYIWLDTDQGREEVEDSYRITSPPLDPRPNLKKNSSPSPSTHNLFSSDPQPLSKLNTRIGLKHAILLSEILGAPVSISRKQFWDVSN